MLKHALYAGAAAFLLPMAATSAQESPPPVENGAEEGVAILPADEPGPQDENAARAVDEPTIQNDASSQSASPDNELLQSANSSADSLNAQQLAHFNSKMKPPPRSPSPDDFTNPSSDNSANDFDNVEGRAPGISGDAAKPGTLLQSPDGADKEKAKMLDKAAKDRADEQNAETSPPDAIDDSDSADDRMEQQVQNPNDEPAGSDQDPTNNNPFNPHS